MNAVVECWTGGRKGLTGLTLFPLQLDKTPPRRQYPGDPESIEKNSHPVRPVNRVLRCFEERGRERMLHSEQPSRVLAWPLN